MNGQNDIATPGEVHKGEDSGAGFRRTLEELLGQYFSVQRRFPTIVGRSVAWSLVDFPIVMVNFPFVLLGILFGLIGLFSSEQGGWKDYAAWFRSRKQRKGRIGRLLPPYRTMSAGSKLKDFKRMVIASLDQKFPRETRSLDLDALEDALLETLSSWEKIPNLLEYLLTPICWLAGISFLGLDPKTAFVLSRDKGLYHLYELHGRSWFGKTYLKIRWLFDDAVPWSYSVKFIVVGLLAYIILMTFIEFLSVQRLYRSGVEQRLLKRLPEEIYPL